MAKAGFWMQGAKGKMAGAVFQKGKKGTVQRVNVTPKNPKTNLQMAQRIIFATVTQAAKYMYPIISHSFEGVAEGADSRQAFIKENVRLLRSAVANDFNNGFGQEEVQSFLTTKNVSNLIPNKYLISKGSVKESNIGFSITGGAVSGFGSVYNQKVVDLAPYEDGDVKVGVNNLDLACKALGMKSQNSQITLVKLVDGGGEPLYTYNEEMHGKIKKTAFVAGRLIFKSDAGEVVELTAQNRVISLSNAFDDLFESGVDFDKSSTEAINFFKGVLSGLEIHISEDLATCTLVEKTPVILPNTFAAGIVISELEGGEWKRSNCRLDVNSFGSDSSQKIGLASCIAIPAWFKTETIAESDKFLNEGGSENQIP